MQVAPGHAGRFALWTATLAALALGVCFPVDAVAASPGVAEIVEPAPGSSPLNPEDVHMVIAYADADADEHLCSDWEIWSLAPSEPVWQAHCAGGQEKVHIHLGDGEFVNSLTGAAALLPASAYELRVRVRDDSGVAPEEWSEWESRGFLTAAAGPPGNEATAWAPRPGFAVEVFASGLQLPVNVEMVPAPGPHPGDPLLYVTELYGTVKAITRDGTVHDYATGLLDFNPTGDFPGSGEMGLTGIAVDPDSGDLFVSLVYEDDVTAEHYPKVVRLHSDEPGLEAVGQTTVLDMAGEVQGASHQVSNLSISPAGELFVHNGDGGDPSTSRDLDFFRGKILRVSLAGQPLPDNPHYDAGDGISARDYVWASGFRNPFGGAIRLSDGSYYEVENGPATDRLARVLPGVDYLYDGTDASMTFGASYTWNPAHAPVNVEFVEPGRFGGSGFPATAMGNAFVTESGSTWATGPQAQGKRIVELGLGPDGALTAGPQTLVEYTGTGKATAVGLAAGVDGLYFTDLYKDTGYETPIDPGANVLRVTYCGACPQEPEPQTVTGSPLVDDSAPRIRRFRVLRKRFAVQRSGRGRARASAALHGTEFLYSLSESASAQIRIRSLARGWRATLDAPGRPGGNRRAFAGRVAGRALPTGIYAATVQARDAAGNLASSRALRFQVVAER